MDERVNRSTPGLYLLNDRIHERRVSDERGVTTQTRYSTKHMCSVELCDSESANFFTVGNQRDTVRSPARPFQHNSRLDINRIAFVYFGPFQTRQIFPEVSLELVPEI